MARGQAGADEILFGPAPRSPRPRPWRHQELAQITALGAWQRLGELDRERARVIVPDLPAQVTDHRSLYSALLESVDRRPALHLITVGPAHDLELDGQEPTELDLAFFALALDRDREQRPWRLGPRAWQECHSLNTAVIAVALALLGHEPGGQDPWLGHGPYVVEITEQILSRLRH